MVKEIWDEKLERMPAEQLFKEIEREKLEKQLFYVVEKSKFYKNKFKKAGMALADMLNNFEEIPFTEKKEVIEDQVLNPAFGTNLCVGEKQIQRVHRTSGTTGRPLFLAVTQADINAVTTCGARCFYASGMRPDDMVFNCLSYCLWMGGYTDHQSMEKTGATIVPYGAGNSKALLEALFLLRPTAIHCTPSYLSRLEVLLKDEFGKKPRDLGLSKGFFGAESGMSDPVFRRVIEQTWGIKAMNANYGMSDVLSMFGAECSYQRGLHFMGQEFLHLEIIDPVTQKNLPILKGVMGEVVLTNLEKKAQPLVRFRTRDLIEVLDHEECDCGRKSFRFNIVGRSDDMLVVKGVNVFPNAIKEILSEYMDFVNGEYQIVLEAPPPLEALKIKIEYRKHLTITEIENIKNEIGRNI